MDTLFFCSIILKSWRRSGAMFLSRKYSGLFSSTLSKYLSLWGAVVGGGEVTTAAWVSPFIAQSFQVPTESKQKTVLFLNQCPVAFHNENISLINTISSMRMPWLTDQSEPWRVMLLCGFWGTWLTSHCPPFHQPRAVFVFATVLQQTTGKQSNKASISSDKLKKYN